METFEGFPLNAKCILEPIELVPMGEDYMSKKEPDYYASNGLSPIGAFKQGLLSNEEYIGFCKGNIIKYVIRAGKKESAIEDLKKAKDYINFYMDIFKLTQEEHDEIRRDLISDNIPDINLPPVEFHDGETEKAKQTLIKAIKGIDKLKED